MNDRVGKSDLIDAILELRGEVENRLRQNKYYVALHKLDELLEAIKPLEAIEQAARETRPRAPESLAETEPLQTHTATARKDAIPTPRPAAAPAQPRFSPGE
jgi:hypothetical protein